VSMWWCSGAPRMLPLECVPRTKIGLLVD